ncbi:MAG: SIMPL domain-containing protein [Mobilitalea sp.]
MTNYKENEQLPYNKMIVTGRGQVTVIPDLAILRLGVQTTGDVLSTAQSENARISQNVLTVLRQLGITDIKTYQYQIEKLYDYENGNRIDRGYSVRNIFEIRMDNMNLVGTAIDTAVNSGANVVEFINFEVADPDFFYQQALNLAVKNAYQKAKSISESLRVMINPIPILITENSAPPIPFSSMYMAREGTFTTPIEPGNKQIEASVTAEFIY